MQINRIPPENIFFTDERIIDLSSFVANCKIRFTKKVQRDLNQGNEIIINLTTL